MLYLGRMSIFKVQIVACNPDTGEWSKAPVEAVVDTGSELTWLPANALREIGIMPRRSRIVLDAATQPVVREVGYVVLDCHGIKTTDEVVFAGPGDQIILGARTLKGFGITVDDKEHSFVSVLSLKPLVLDDLPKAA
jgi:predicted aspartyl protease